MEVIMKSICLWVFLAATITPVFSQQMLQNPRLLMPTTIPQEELQNIMQQYQQHLFSQQRNNHAEYVKNYKPTLIEKPLAWCHTKRCQFNEFCNPTFQEKKSFCKKLIKAPYKIGSAILSPVTWISNTITTPLLSIITYYPTKYSTHNLINKYIASDKKIAEMDEFERNTINTLTQNTTGLVYTSLTKISSHYTDKFVAYFAEKFLSKIISTKNLPDFAKHPETYKNEVVRRLLKKFEPNLPQNLQHGKAYNYYLKGKRMYDHAKLVYDLVDNVTAALSISYQLTHHAQINGQAPMMVQSRLKKFFMVVDISYRCIDSYLKIVNHFKLDKNESQGIKRFQKVLSCFVGIAKVVCPWQNYIVTGKQLYELTKLLTKPRQEMVAFLQKHYRMSKNDANKIYDLTQKINDLSRESTRRYLKQKRRLLFFAERILNRYGANLKSFYQDFNEYCSLVNQKVLS